MKEAVLHLTKVINFDRFSLIIQSNYGVQVATVKFQAQVQTMRFQNVTRTRNIFESPCARHWKEIKRKRRISEREQRREHAHCSWKSKSRRGELTAKRAARETRANFH